MRWSGPWAVVARTLVPTSGWLALHAASGSVVCRSTRSLEVIMWLRCELVKFGSPGDEEAFFQWIQRIRAVRQVRGEGRFILLHVPRRRISNDHLCELIALFHRDKSSISQLDAI